MCRRSRLLLLAAIGLLTIAVVGLLGLFLAARHEPAFYREATALEPAVLEEGSDRMLQKATALASAVKKPGRWEALFSAREVNGWLAVDMFENHVGALPSGMRDPRVAIESGRVTIACRFEQGAISSVLSLTVEPFVPEPNVIALRIVSARAGLLPAPLNRAIDRISQAARDMRLRLEWRTADGAPVALLSLPEINDGSPLHIESLRLGDGEIYVSGTVERPKHRTP